MAMNRFDPSVKAACPVTPAAAAATAPAARRPADVRPLVDALLASDLRAEPELRAAPAAFVAGPGRPLPPGRLRDVHAVVVHEARESTRRAGCAECPPPDPIPASAVDRLCLEKPGLPLEALSDLAEQLLKEVALSLHADLIGGENVTRLDRVVCCDHPRLTYREALAILSRRGHNLCFGDELGEGAAATLVFHCGHRPVQIVRASPGWADAGWRADPRDPAQVESLHYALPYAGIAARGGVRPAGAERAGDPPLARLSLDVPRLLQSFLGLRSLADVNGSGHGNGHAEPGGLAEMAAAG